LKLLKLLQPSHGLLVLATVVALVFGCAGSSAAQVATATLGGRVVDAQGAAAPGATVTIRSATTGVTWTAVSGSDGRFSVPMLPPGTYAAEVQLAGFSTWRGEGLVLQDSTREGVQLCRQGSEDACMALVGRYVGDIPAVPGARVWLTYPVRLNLEMACLYWFLFGLAATAWAAFAGTGERQRAR